MALNSDGVSIIDETTGTLYFSYAIPLQSSPEYPLLPHSHAIVLSYRNVLI